MSSTEIVGKWNIRKLVFAVLICILSIILVPSIAERNGMWGELSWHLDDYGTLAITGTGRMNGFDYSEEEGWKKYNKAIKKVTIQHGITNIGENAFSQCTQLVTIVIPESVVSIDRAAFEGCINLQLDNIPGHVKNVGVLSFCDCDSISHLLISEGVEVIDIGAFSSCDSLISVSIPDSVISIGDDNFAYCQNLKNVYVSDWNRVLYIIDSVLFTKDGRLLWYPATKYDSDYVVPSGTTTLSYDAFWNCKAQTIEIPESVEVIQGHCFSDSERLKKVTIKGDNTWIKCAFDDCVNLKELYILGRNNKFGNQYTQEIGMEQYDNTTIYCYKGSTAEGYADSMGLKKILLDEQDDYQQEKIVAFVTRCYEIILGRVADENGRTTWVNELSSGRKAAAEIIERFVGSAEFQNKHLSNGDAVEILYKAMLGRGSDPAGKADWVAKLDAGQHLTAVINGFSGSAEFKAICDSYGINPGTVAVQENPGAANEKIKAYVERCYQIILGRGADEDGMNTWSDELAFGRKAAAEIIEQFVASTEFQNQEHNNEESVEILYNAMLGRGSDPAGKADWVEKLNAGQHFTAVINGFCGSAEFKAICDTYGIQPGTVNVQEPTVPSANDEKIRAFVTRCYKIILGRDADEGGMNTWFNELKSRSKAAAEIIEQFVSSSEFQNQKHSDPDAVEILYKAMLGRGSDAAGKADWVAKLNNGQPLTAVINGFCGSTEFKAICDAYGITPGSVQVQLLSSQPAVEEEPAAKQTITKTENNVTKVEIVNPSDTENAQLGTAVQAIYINEEKTKEFIGRCYRCILGREASQSELDSWIGQMLNGTKTADQIARGFLFSGEFKDKNVSNEELVKILYRVYLNREADAEGLATWTQKLDEGTSLKELLDAFAKTNEFIVVVRDMAQ